MSALADFTSLVWWLMLLASTGIILHDMVEVPSSSKRPAKPDPPLRPRIASGEDETIVIARRVKRGLDRPSNFMILQREIAQVIWQLVTTIHGQVGETTTRKPDREMIERYVQDREISAFLEDKLLGGIQESVRMTRSEIPGELKRTMVVLERAEGILK